MRLIAGVLALILASGCATLRKADPFRNADGTLNVEKIITWVEFGIQADCHAGELGQGDQSKLMQDICTFGEEGISIARATLARDPQAAAPVVRKAVMDALARVPADKAATIRAYFGWALKLLDGVGAKG